MYLEASVCVIYVNQQLLLIYLFPRNQCDFQYVRSSKVEAILMYFKNSFICGAIRLELFQN